MQPNQTWEQDVADRDAGQPDQRTDEQRGGPGITDLISCPAISASRAITTVRCEPSRAARTGAAKPITANARVGSDSRIPVVAAGSPVAARSSGMTAPERVDHRAEVDRQ